MKIDWNTFTKKYTRPKKNLFPTGSRVYKGFQGSGKTLSMVKYALDLHKKFPDCLIFSNVHIKGIPATVTPRFTWVSMPPRTRS